MLVKQAIDVSFAQGLDTKTDPKRVQVGNFLSLENMVFQKGGLLQKRNGYASLPALPDSSYSYLTTFNEDATAIGPNIAAYSQPNGQWVQKGSIQPLSLSTLPVIRNNLNQSQGDCVVAANGMACAVYLEVNNTTTTAKYVIFDSVTGQNIIAPSVIPVGSGVVTGGMRVFLLGTNFILVFTNVISSTSHLQYVAISSVNPSSVGSNTDIAAAYVSSTTLSWDGYVAENRLYLAYNNTSGGQSVKVTSLSSALVFSNTVTFSGYKATLMSVTADITNPANPTVYVSFYRSDTSLGFTLALNSILGILMNPVEIIASGTILNLTSVAQNGTCSIFGEVSNVYSYDNNIASNYVSIVTVTPLVTTFDSVFSNGDATITVSSATGLVNGMYLIDNTTPANVTAGTTFTISGTTLTPSNTMAGNSATTPGDVMTAATVSSASVVLRSVGLASKAFIINGTIYFLAAYASTYQPTYILVNGSSTAASPVIAAKLAYSNGGGYVTQGLPGVTVRSNTAKTLYLFKDLIQAVNKNTDVPSGTQTAGIYSQTGINLATFTIGTQDLDTAEIGQNLHISGGFPWMYDGYLPVEHSFIVWPDSIELTGIVDPTPTGTVSNVTNPTIMTSVSSVQNITVGMNISGSGVPANTTVVAVGSTTVTMSNAATGAHSAATYTFTGNVTAQQYYYQVTYEWTDNQGNAHRSAPSIPVTITTTSGHSSIGVYIPYLRLTMKVANPVKIVVYRWSAGQQVYYQTTSITSPILNSTTSDSLEFQDINSDTTILGNNIIYTNGGVVENIQAPASNVFALFDTRMWILDAEDSNLLWFSKQVIETTPVETSDLFTLYVPPTIATIGSTGPILSLAPMDDKLIIGKQNALLYINGNGPDNTGSNNQYSQPIFITSSIGSPNQKSIVLIPTGLMFQTDKGIWLLDRGLGINYIGAAVEDFTTGTNVTSAVLVPNTNQVRFTLDSGITLMYDYYYQQWGTFVGVPAVSSCIYQSLHTFINDLGSAYQESPGFYQDGSNPVLMSFETGPLRIGSLQNYQRAYFFYFLGTYYSPHKLAVSVSYDYSRIPEQTSIISPINYSTPYGSGASQSPYGQGNPYGGPSSLENWRVFLKKQRCMAFGIKVQEIFDSTLASTAGQGLSLSGINVMIGFKRGFRPQDNQTSVG